MILVWLLIIPLAAGLLAWIFGHRNHLFARWISLIAMVADLALALSLWYRHFEQVDLVAGGGWLIEYSLAWVPQLGISFYLGVDGLSILMIVLSAFLGVLAVATSWSEITKKVGFFHFNLMWIMAGIIGVFMALDLFLFYFFWELMLVPMYFLIGIWGHEKRLYASVKFFIFTQLSGLLMLAAILGLYFVHQNQTGIYTFNYNDLLGTPMAVSVGRWLMLGFFAAFAVKLPAFPFHPWLADAHTEAPTAGSLILAGLLLKTGAYGFLRFVLPLFPEASEYIAPAAMIVGVVGIIYGAILAFGQTDLKRLVAYTSVSHMGFVILGIFTFNQLALQGVVMQMICHGLSTGGLFIIAGHLQEQIHTRDMNRMGGMWENLPRFGGVAMFFALASLGLPGLGNFIGEFLVLIGAFQTDVILTVVAACGLVFAAIYSLWIIQQTFHGEKRAKYKIPDLSPRFILIFAVMIIPLVILGLFPQPVIDTAQPAIERLERINTIDKPGYSGLDLPRAEQDLRHLKGGD